MKFIADVMLGKLARRLRLLGISVHYDAAATDNEVLRQSLEQGLTILTRDTGLAARPLAGNTLLIRSDRPAEQIKEVFASFPSLMHHSPLTRCSICNHRLESANPVEVRDRVPPHVQATVHRFLLCNGCGRVYWKGSHVARMGLAGGKRKRPASS